MQQHTVIPMSFGTVFKTDDDIMELLRSAYDAFQDVLQKMEGKFEFGLKVLWDRDHVVSDIEQGDEDIRRLKGRISSQQGSTYFARMQYGRLLDIARSRPVNTQSGSHSSIAKPQSSLPAAAIIALFFGLHPLRVESVAWATERRDLLSAFFLLLTVLAYLHAVGSASRPGSKWAVITECLFACSLLSKVIGVTLPLVLLVLDWHPLRRSDLIERLRGSRDVLLEGPLFIMSRGLPPSPQSAGRTVAHRAGRPRCRMIVHLCTAWCSTSETFRACESTAAARWTCR
jgi:hypothetical protein